MKQTKIVEERPKNENETIQTKIENENDKPKPHLTVRHHDTLAEFFAGTSCLFKRLAILKLK